MMIRSRLWNSARGYRCQVSGWPWLGRLLPVLRELTSMLWLPLLCGEHRYYKVSCIDDCAPKLSLPWYLLDRVTVGFDISYFFPIYGIASNCLLFLYVNIYEQRSYLNAYVKNKSLDVLAKQNRKRKKLKVSYENDFVLIFWSWPVIGVFVQGGWRSSKITPP